MKVRVVLILLAAIVLFACETPPPKRVGTEGWELVRALGDESIHVRQKEGEVQIWEYKAGVSYVIRYVRPLGKARVPLFPGSRHHDTQERATWVNYVYTMPSDKRFPDVYRWYMNWFDFKVQEEPAPKEAPRKAAPRKKSSG